MSRLKKRKLLVVFVGVFFCLILSVAVRVNASSSMRFYMRHDCSDADSTYANVDDTDNIINQDDNYNISIIGIHFCGGNGNNGSIKITEDLLHFYLNNNFVY